MNSLNKLYQKYDRHNQFWPKIRKYSMHTLKRELRLFYIKNMTQVHNDNENSENNRQC